MVKTLAVAALITLTPIQLQEIKNKAAHDEGCRTHCHHLGYDTGKYTGEDEQRPCDCIDHVDYIIETKDKKFTMPKRRSTATGSSVYMRED
jgi:hypothetical protein